VVTIADLTGRSAVLAEFGKDAWPAQKCSAKAGLFCGSTSALYPLVYKRYILCKQFS